MSVTVRAPAKVNLHLGVGQLRGDGFHSLVSVFQAVSIYDEVTVDVADDLEVTIVGDDYDDVPTDASNLAARAAIALAHHVGRAPDVQITIQKGIPVAGGMAGGSADAAATLLACDALWQTGVDPHVLHDIAARLGSDVPFCLLGGTALGGGRGEQLTQVLVRGTYHWVFALADTGLPTPTVYGELDRMRSEGPWPESSSPRELIAALGAGDPRRLGSPLAQRPAKSRASVAAGIAPNPRGRPRCARTRRDRVWVRPDVRVLDGGRGRGGRVGCRTSRVGDVSHGTTRSRTGARSARRRMNLVNLESVSLSYGVKPLLDDVSLGIAEGDRIGIVGRNGAGKTTLLSVLAGDVAPNSGRVTHTSGLRIGVLAQGDALDPAATVRHVVLGDRPDHSWAGDRVARTVVSTLLSTDMLDRVVGTLSGGERRRTALAALLVTDIDLLMLDEPTNHLDIETIDWLAGFLASRRGALVVVTHDRWFLDAVCTLTWEVADGQIAQYLGGYAAYVLARAERERISGVVEERRQNLLRKELAWLRRGPPARTSKPQFRIDAANALIADEPPARDRTTLGEVFLSPLGKIRLRRRGCVACTRAG